MQCPACHNEVAAQNAFCNHCGAALTGAQAPPPPTYQNVQPTYTPPVQQGSSAPPPPGTAPAGAGMSENSAAAIAYLTFIPAIIFLVMEPYNKMPLVRFHSFQSIALNVVAFALHVAILLMSVVLHFIPLMWMLTMLLHIGVNLALFIGWLMAIIKASKGEWYRLPIIGDFADKQARS